MAGRTDKFFTDFQQSNENTIFISSGPASAQIRLKASFDRLYVIADGEPSGQSLVECFRKGVEKGAVHASMRTLVDLTRFTGAVDWRALHTIRDMGLGSAEGQSRVAYVVRNNVFDAIIKVVQILFVNARHRTFENPADAIAWLEAKRR
ncbi:MAG TPA: STAS/SEC14 domain-containing protein [Micropepsaceae bacterium]|nr:STAS/SEC14 domain-containing protein [Micropepsaceae bacterium]